MTLPAQPGILDSVPAVARYVAFNAAAGADRAALGASVPGLDGSSHLAVQQWVHGFDAFEAQLRRMAGQEDGAVDAMFRISRPVNGAYLWCPPAQGGRLDLRRLGL